MKVDESKLMRRVAGFHDIRMDGMTDLVVRARGLNVFDIGCNRGLVAFEMANNGARRVCGCDNYEEGIQTARQLFIDLRNVESKFEVVDLTKGPREVDSKFGREAFDIVLMLATYHKIKRIMSDGELEHLMADFAARTRIYFAWRGTSDKPNENEEEIRKIAAVFEPMGFRKIHTSYISQQLGACCIWQRVK